MPPSRGPPSPYKTNGDTAKFEASSSQLFQDRNRSREGWTAYRVCLDLPEAPRWNSAQLAWMLRRSLAVLAGFQKEKGGGSCRSSLRLSICRQSLAMSRWGFWLDVRADAGLRGTIPLLLSSFPSLVPRLN